MEIDLLWTAAMAELRFIRLSAGIETVKMTEIVEVTMMILVSKKWLFKAVLSLTDAASAAAIIWN